MTQEPARPKLRLALTAFPERYVLPGRPAAIAPVVQDAYRQTLFLLGGDLAVFERAMNLQLQIVAANARLRTPQAAAIFAFWSRTFTCLSDTCSLMGLGSYASCPPLLRTACDCIAAQRSLLADGFAEYEQWLPGAISQDREHVALAIDLGRFRAGSVLAQDQRLGSAYRLLTDLCMPHFGSTALQTAPDSNLQRLAIAFADSAFHLGWAELTAGWLLTLAGAQIETVAGSNIFALNGDLRRETEIAGQEIGAAVANPRRCHVKEVAGRFLFHNFRRTASGAPKRVLL